SKATVIAWIWARTVACPNPACGATMPLVRSFWLSKKKDRPTWLRPVVTGKQVTFEVVVDRSGPPIEGTVGRQGAICVVCQSPVPLKHIRAEGQAGRMEQQLMAVVAEGQRQRIYLPATEEQVTAANVPRPADVPEAELPKQALGFRVQGYGMELWADLFTNRQLVALTALSDLVAETRARCESDARAAGMATPKVAAYADAVAMYLALVVGRLSDYLASTTTWASNPQMEILVHTFGRQAIAMTWDFAEGNPLADSSGSVWIMIRAVSRVVEALTVRRASWAEQDDAMSERVRRNTIVCTDPPYYDNIAYADLSDFFYIWLRRSLQDVFPDLLSTVLTPKADELVASPFRFGGSQAKADAYFESGFVRAFTRMRQFHPADVPITLFYAFKQAETQQTGVASTGWETMLNGLMEAGLTVTATWPVRTERRGRLRDTGSNALASSIVLACRPRLTTAESTTRRGFLQALKLELPKALRELQQGSIAPVDLAQAAIGPGMAVFTRYRSVIEADGSPMTVRTALALINHALDEVLFEQEGDFDADTRFCVKWFSQFGWDEQPYGRAEELSRSTDTSVPGLVRGGVFWARAGRARLLGPEDLASDWDPVSDERVSVWEATLRLAKALTELGGQDAARLMSLAGQRVDLDTVKELAYLLYSVCEKRGWTQTALLFNGLGTSWSDLSASARGAAGMTQPTQGAFGFDDDEEA
ncbi:MAG: hypothetical protein M3070_10125, partial [Actinomycetota bacterium]|nr:hypothetical protein [Actinomycetota bacterium]